MHPNSSKKSRRRDVRLSAESLETRSLMTGGAGNTFAIVPGEIAAPDEPAAIKFTIDSNFFTLPRGKLALGVDVAPAADSQAKVLVGSVSDPQGNTVPQTFHSVYDPTLPRKSVALGAATSAVITPVTYRHRDAAEAYEYTVNVEGIEKTTGRFLVGFYLPGDANGDGSVDQADVNIVRSSMFSKAGDGRYSFDADANRDGRIGRIDLTFTQRNLGARTTIIPTVSANLDAASDTGLPDRVTTARDVRFTGATSPNAEVTYSEVRGLVPPVSTKANPDGNYDISVKLGDGPNTFKVTTRDGFGQSINGVIAPVTFSTATAVTAADLAALREGTLRANQD